MLGLWLYKNDIREEENTESTAESQFDHFNTGKASADTDSISTH